MNSMSDELAPLYSEQQVAERAEEYPIPTEEEYIAEVADFPWDVIVERAKQQGLDMLRELLSENPTKAAQIMRDFADCTLFGTEYLGSVMALYPSGKYYTPWASSNLEPCAHCVDGALEFTVPCPICNGKGYLEVTEELHEAGPFWREFPIGHKHDCAMCDAKGSILKVCPWCGGYESEEAYRDDLFHHALENAAEEHGGFILNGEGDPTDIFFGIALTKQEIVSVRDDIAAEDAAARDNAPMAGRGRTRKEGPIWLL